MLRSRFAIYQGIFVSESSEQVTQGIEGLPQKPEDFCWMLMKKDKVGGTGRTFSWEFCTARRKADHLGRWIA